MSARVVNCVACSREASKMAPTYQGVVRAFMGDDYDQKAFSESEVPRWLLRLLLLSLYPLLAAGSFLIVVCEALLGFGLVIGGLIAFSSNAILGGASIALGTGVFLFMIRGGINAVFGGR